MSSIMDIIYVPFGWLMGVFYSWTGNYAVALLIFSVVVNLLMLPFAIKQHKNMRKGAMLRPKMAVIEKKYANKKDQASLQKKQEEMMELQRAEGYSPFAGCLPMLIQMPIIIALFRIIRNPLTYICDVADEKLVSVYRLINNLPKTVPIDIESIDQIRLASSVVGSPNSANLLARLGENIEIPDFTMFGGRIDLSLAPNAGETIWTLLLLVPILSAVLSFVQMKISRKLNGMPQPTDATREARMSGHIMDITMPLMSFYISFITSASVGVYWIYRSILGIIQTVVLAFAMPMPKFTDEDFAAAEREMRRGKKGQSKSAPTARPGSERPRSLHHIDDDDELPYELKRKPSNPNPQNKNKSNKNKNKNKNYHPNNTPSPAKLPDASAPTQSESAQNSKPASEGSGTPDRIRSGYDGISAAPIKDDSDR